MKRYWLIFAAMMIVSGVGRAQNSGFVNIIIDGSVHYIVSDSGGRRTGIDARTGIKYAEIPNTTYGLACCGSTDPYDSSDEGWEFTFLQPVTSPFREHYMVQVI